MMKKLLFLLLGLFLAINPCLGQEGVKDAIFSWDSFEGGLDVKTSSFSLSKSKATIAENIRFGTELGSITKRDQIMSYGTMDTSEAVTGLHRLYLKDGSKILIGTHGDEIEKGNDATGAFTAILDLATGDYRWQWITWHDLAIGGDGYNPPVKTNGTDATYLGSCFAEDAGSGAGPNGVYTYKITFYTTSYEVSFDTASNSITIVDNDISLSMIPIGPDTFLGEDVTGRKVYRTSAGGSDYKLLSNGTIADNTTVILTDSDADGERGVALDPDYTYAPPKGKFFLVHDDRLFIANIPSTSPSRIHYSDYGNPDYFEADAYFNIRQDDGDEITFIKNLLGILTIGKTNTIQKLYTQGDDPANDWEISDPFSFIGCQASYSVVNSPLGIIYLNYSGLYKFNGQYSTLISDAVTPVIEDISKTNFPNCWGEFRKNIYYLAYTSSSSGEAENNRILLFDIIANAYAIDLFSVNAFCVFNSGTDWGTLYSGSSSDGAVYCHTETVHEVIHKRHSDFTGTFDDMRYIPTTAGGDADDPVLEISWTITINGASGTINTHSYGEDAIIDRPDTDGSYISQVMYIGATTFDKLYWNETIPGAGGDVLFYVRSGASAAACAAADWSSSFTDPSGSDISGVTANDYVQYKVALSTDDIDYTPTLYKANNYVVRLTYDVEGATSESTVPFRWASGWQHLGYPGRIKTLKKLQCIHNSPDQTGTLTLKFYALEYDIAKKQYVQTSDTFGIDLKQNPESYIEYFTNMALNGEWFKLEISESSLYDLIVKKVLVTYDVQPLY